MNSQIFKIKQFDTLPKLKVSITTPSRLNAHQEFDLSEVNNITFTMVKQNCDEVKILEQSASTICASAGTIQYEWKSTDTDEYGSFLGEFTLNYSNGNKLTVPQNEPIKIEITKSINPFKD